ncbi:MAG: TonB-dependent receptor, partial [Ekhidna sp.]
GSANVRILIDGKPSPLNNADLLAQINASHVERVEIITAPSAKFQADGQSGIINIVLKDKVIKGLAGSIDLDGRTNPRYGSGINLTFGLGELNIQGGASYRNSFSVNKRTVYREFQMNGNSQNVSAISEFSGDVSNINIKADWFLNTTNDLSLSYRWTNNEHFITPVTHIYNENSGIVVNRLHNYHQHLSRSYNVNYRKRFDSKKQRFVDFDITLNQNQNTLPSKAEVDDTVVLDNELFYDNYILNTALDFTWDIDHKLSVEAGSLYTRKFIDNNQLRRSLEGSRELAYTYNEHNYASYILLKKGWEKIGLQLGIRSEYFQSDGLINNEVNAIDREFFNLFPSAHFSYKRSESLSYSLSYNRRIGRPSFYELNPLTTINNPLYRREGNPNLTPEFTNNIELGVNWNKSKFSLNSSLYYRRTKDIINRLFDVDENGNTIMIFSNGGQ